MTVPCVGNEPEGDFQSKESNKNVVSVIHVSFPASLARAEKEKKARGPNFLAGAP